MMTRDQMLQALQQSSRWGCNNQPSMETVCDVLYQLLVVRIVVTDKRGDELEVEFARPLNQRECFLLFGLEFGAPDQVDE